MHVVSRAYEVDYLGHDPHQPVTNEVFFHDLFALGVSSGACVAGSDKPSIIKQQSSFGPKDRVVRV